MRPRQRIAAVAVSIVASATPASAAQAAQTYHPTEREWPLLSGATQTFAVPIERLGGKDGGTIVGCWGFEIAGPGIDYADRKRHV